MMMMMIADKETAGTWTTFTKNAKTPYGNTCDKQNLEALGIDA